MICLGCESNFDGRESVGLDPWEKSDQGMVKWQGQIVWMARLRVSLLQRFGNIPSLYVVSLTTLYGPQDRPLHNPMSNPNLTSLSEQNHDRAMARKEFCAACALAARKTPVEINHLRNSV